jgi:serine/threonine protein kinase
VTGVHRIEPVEDAATDLSDVERQLTARRWAVLRGAATSVRDEWISRTLARADRSVRRCQLREVADKRGLLLELGAVLDPRRTVEDDEPAFLSRIVDRLRSEAPAFLVFDGAAAVEAEAILVASELVVACESLRVLIVVPPTEVRHALTVEPSPSGLPCRDIQTEVAIRREGAFQRLYTIKCYRLDRRVANRAREATVARLRRVSILRHPAVLSIYDVGWDGPRLFTVSELAEGVSLKEILDRVPPGALPTQLALRISAAVARALQAAHGLSAVDGRPARVAHGDLSPSSILVSHDGTVRACDFSIARELRRAAGMPHGEDDIGAQAVADVHDLGRVLRALLDRSPASPLSSPFSLAADMTAWPLLRCTSAARLAADRLEAAAVRIEVREGIVDAADFVARLFDDDLRSRQSAALQRDLDSIVRRGGRSVRFALVPPAGSSGGSPRTS